MQYYCPSCFVKIPREERQRPCPSCGTDAGQWQHQHTFVERMIHALQHPNPETRMMSIITLGNRRQVEAILPLTECAMGVSSDVIQSLQIVKSLIDMPECTEKTTALHMLTDHRASAVRRRVQEYLDEQASC
ncbi:MAG: HEAT repeat domain-containing protein [Chloroflexaceae bacterium]|nr:HEAT repeat domain-containing protein [Chloroflexaceae bacterium]